MTFVSYKFTEADQTRYDSFHLKNELNTFRYPAHRTVDAERNALFVSFGGQGDLSPEDGRPPNFFALSGTDV